VETDDKTGLSLKILPFQVWKITYICHNILLFKLLYWQRITYL
jgi:hypothetical protein